MKKFLLLSFMLMFTFASSNLWAQERTISGMITSVEDGSALPGVNVVLKGTTSGTVTDIDGNYSLSVPSEGGILVFSFIGLASEEVEIGTRSVIDLQMSPDVQQLSEVVITGYGSTLKKEVTGSISSIKQEDIAKIPASNVQSIIQGQSSGVFVTSSSGQPGGSLNVRVRGSTSINASNAPLYIIDGVPVIAGGLNLTAFGGQDQSALNGLNPQDIESLEILKDASVTAIYGARAANGVVLITTKKGKLGKPRVSVNAWTGFAEVTNEYETADAQLYFDTRSFVGGTNTETVDWDGETDTDWQDEVLRTANVSEYNVSLSGGTAETKYFISGSYRDEEAVYIGGGLQRFTGRVNLDHNASDALSFSARVGISTELNERIENDNNIFGVLSAALLTPATVAVRDENGDFNDALPGFGTNPVRAAERSRNDVNTIKLIGSLTASYEILDGLVATAQFAYDLNELTEDINSPASTQQGAPTGTGRASLRRVGQWNFEPRINYNFTVGDDHNFNALVGGTLLERKDFDLFVDGNTFGKEELTYLESAAVIDDGRSQKTPYRFNSVFARVGYSFNEKYIVNASVRRDGSSRFGEDNRFGTFWSVSGAWNFADEDFLSDLDWLEIGKLRAGYGIVGNDAIDDFVFTGAFQAGNYQGQSTFERLQIENALLQWEETATIEAGIELSLFQSKLDLGVNYFKANSTELLNEAPLPRTTGFNDVQSNIGEIENRGVEVDLGYRVLSLGDFSWNFNANITFIENEVVDLINEEPILQGFSSAIIEGEPLGTFYGLKWLGVDPATGESQFQDTNGDGIISGDDNVVFGDANPDFFGGFTNTFTYKGFTLDVLFQYVGGIDLYNNTRNFLMNPSSSFDLLDDIKYAWRQPGDVTFVPRLDGAGLEFSNDNSRWMQEGDYLRLKNVTLSYSFPADIISKFKLESLRVYATGTNLLTFTKYEGIDPEISTFGFTNTAPGTEFLTVPQTRLLSFGINVGF